MPSYATRASEVRRERVKPIRLIQLATPNPNRRPDWDNQAACFAHASRDRPQTSTNDVSAVHMYAGASGVVAQVVAQLVKLRRPASAAACMPGNVVEPER